MLIVYQDNNWSTVGFLESPTKNTYVTNKILVLCHASRTHKAGLNRSFINISEKLRENGFYVFRFDLPGEGESIIFNNNIKHTDLVLGLITYLKEKYNIQEINLLGDCLGGKLCIYLTQTQPSYFNKIILWNMHDFLFNIPEIKKNFNKFPPGYYIKQYFRKILLKQTWLKLLRFDVNWANIAKYTLFNLWSLLIKKKLPANTGNDNKYDKEFTHKVLIIHDTFNKNDLKNIIYESDKYFKKINMLSFNYVIHDSALTYTWQENAFQETISWLSRNC